MAMISGIEQGVHEALEQDKRTSKYTIEVINQNGLITLKGEVHNEKDRKAAVEIASQQNGVIKVIDELEIIKLDKEPNLAKYQEIINRASNR